MAPPPSKAVTAEKPVQVESTKVEPPKLQNGDNETLEKNKKGKKEKIEEDEKKEKGRTKDKKLTPVDVSHKNEQSPVKEKEKKSKKAKKGKKPKDTNADEESAAAPPSVVQSVANGTSTQKSEVFFSFHHAYERKRRQLQPKLMLMK